MLRGVNCIRRGLDRKSSKQQSLNLVLLRHGKLLQGRSHVLLQEEKEGQERSRLLQRQGQAGVLLLQGRFMPHA